MLIILTNVHPVHRLSLYSERKQYIWYLNFYCSNVAECCSNSKSTKSLTRSKAGTRPLVTPKSAIVLTIGGDLPSKCKIMRGPYAHHSLIIHSTANSEGKQTVWQVV